ncbi:MAG: L-glyceraldehyde 3-phosphate reductase [Firmicutes bacterium]|nr:L-glyceraldehyde 3-phosphate reductase [Bacillota bacterium]
MEFSPTRYDNMQYRRCGRSGLLLPLISLGAYETYGSYVGEDVARACLYRAFDLGITHFDLANNYGVPYGNAEKMVGKIIKDMPRDELIISTKAGWDMWPGPYGEWLSKKYLVASLDQSLQRLGLDYVDIFYAHRPDPHTPLEETMEALDLIVRQGKALYIGVSSFSGAHFEEACKVVERHNLSRILIHQPSYSMLNRRIEWDLLDHTKRNGTGVITFATLGQGLLTSKYLDGRIPEDSRAGALWGEGGKSRFTPETLAKVRALNDIAANRGQTLAQMAVAWVLRLPEITSVLLGASRVSQLEENVAALANLEFAPEELAEIDRITGDQGRSALK